ncbi:MAG: MurT ligase domain-containing protein [Bacilli bacterium]|nr:MurT ligase domain-containing protein [Bacilli bacterium]
MKLFMKARFILAFYISKLGLIFIELIKKDKGTHFPGAIALKICPKFLQMIEKPKTIVAVTGTNGKTSTSNFVNHILLKNNITTINNSKGSNLSAGIASSLIKAATMKRKIIQEVGIFEVDERASVIIFNDIKPTYLICTNLFRDSIKRNGHSELILNKLKLSIPDETILILNADDIISNSIGSKTNKKIYFAVDKISTDKPFENIVIDARVCPLCKYPLKYKYHHYHHIGSVYCENCKFKSPKSNYLATHVDFNKLTFTIKEKDGDAKYNLISSNILSLYNLTAAIAFLNTYGLSHQQIKNATKNLALKKDRYENKIIKNIEVVKMLSKNQNPVSCSRMFDYVSSENGSKAIVLCVTDSKDAVHGSEDISWLYDTDFEYLKEKDIKQIIVCGTRSYDTILRLKLAGIDEKIISCSLDYKDVEKKLMMENLDKVFILYELYAYQTACYIEKKIVERMSGIK